MKMDNTGTLLLFCLFSLTRVQCEDFQACGEKAADIMLVLDASGSILMADFKKQLQFAQDVVTIFDIGSEKTRVGVLSFSTHVVQEIGLGQMNEKEDILNRISTIQYQGGGTNTGEALHKLLTEVFIPGVMRDDVAHIAIVLTDGMSHSKDYNTIDEANKLHKQGVTVFAIGIGDQVIQRELTGIASHPPEKYTFQVDDYDALDTIKSQLVTRTCEEPPATASPRVGEQVCLPRVPTRVNVGFDLSAVGTENAKRILEFVSQITSYLNQGTDGTVVSLVTSGTCGLPTGDNGYVVSNAHTSEDVMQRMNSFRRAAFNTIMRKMRQGVRRGKDRKHGIVFLDRMLTSKEMQSSLIEKMYASYLNLNIIVIGVGNGAIEEQGMKLGSYFAAGSYDSLLDISQQVECML